MSDGLLSQAEIDALLRGGTEPASPLPELSPLEKDALGEIGNISMGSAATTLSVLLGRRVSITTPRVSVTTLNDIKRVYPIPYIIIQVQYIHGLEGCNLLAIRERDALIIADLMMGGDGSQPPNELNDLYLSAVSEAMNQMMGSTATAMSTMFKKRIDIAPPQVSRVDFANNPPLQAIADDHEPIACVAFKMEVENLINSEIMQLSSVAAAKEFAFNLLNAMETLTTAGEQTAATAPASQTASQLYLKQSRHNRRRCLRRRQLPNRHH